MLLLSSTVSEGWSLAFWTTAIVGFAALLAKSATFLSSQFRWGPLRLQCWISPSHFTCICICTNWLLWWVWSCFQGAFPIIPVERVGFLLNICRCFVLCTFLACSFKLVCATFLATFHILFNIFNFFLSRSLSLPSSLSFFSLPLSISLPSLMSPGTCLCPPLCPFSFLFQLSSYVSLVACHDISSQCFFFF